MKIYLKKVTLIVSCVFYIFSIALSHEQNKAFFTFYFSKDKIRIEADLPWATRKSLLKTFPYLKNSTNYDSFQIAFFKYLQTNLILLSKNKEPFKLLSFKHLPKSKEHPHGGGYNFFYKGKELNKITNTLLFNIFYSQQNIHILPSEKGNISLITTPSSPTITLKKESGSFLYFFWFFIISVLICLSILFYLHKIKPRKK